MVDDVMREINELRSKIDIIDREIVSKLNERANLALDIRKLKFEHSLQLYDPGREEEIFKNVTSVNDGPLYDDDLRGIYEAILHAMKNLD